MSSEKKWVDEDHYRVTSDDGKTSWLYEADGSLLGTDTCIEVADHHSDGTTTAYEHEHGFMKSLFDGGRGKKK
jgi:hypothetical protein